MTTFLLTPLLAAGGTPAPAGNGSGAGGVDLTSFLVLRNGAKVSDVFKTPASMMNLIISNLFVAAGLFVFVTLIMAGFKFLTHEAKGMEEAKTLLTNAGLGFALMFTAYWIVQIMQYLTGMKLLF
ncbi:MAG TPA: hypothetical protein DEP87_00665 [Candidatus Pacebacteria bacterium]|nr:hypothetical protein [Candidatus Paceibacterota bacterium]